MSALTAIVITVLAIAIIGFIVVLAILLNNKTSEATLEQSNATVKSATSATVKSHDELIQDSKERQTCMLKLGNDKETVVIGEPWYIDQTNPEQCFAPAGQKCCEQTNLPNGDQGCLANFSGYDQARISNWKNDCLATGGALDMDKLEILNTSFSGDWIVLEKDGEESKDDIQFTLEISGVNLKIKKDNELFGMYNIIQLTINPTKHLKAHYESDIGETTDVILEDNAATDTALVLRMIDTPINSDKGHLTTYTLKRI